MLDDIVFDVRQGKPKANELPDFSYMCRVE